MASSAPSAADQEQPDVVHELNLKGKIPLKQARPLDALHHMLQEASVLSSHLRGYRSAVDTYASKADRFFDALHDFMASSGDPALYENTLTPDGITAARAAAGAAAVAETQHLPPDASAAAGVVMAQQQQQHDATSTTPSPLHDDTTAATAAATAAAGSSSSSDGTESSPFAPEAALLRLPLLGAAGVTQSGVCLCPGVPNTAALGVKGGLTKVVPAELHLPKQHAQLFSTEVQRSLLTRGSTGLRDVLRGQLMTTMQLWLDTYEECKSMLPQVEHLRVAAESARNKLDTAMAAVVAAEQKSPLVTPSTTAAGVAVPRVLVRGSEGTLLTHNTAAGGAGAGDGGSGGSGGSGGGVDAAVVSSASGGAEYGGGPELVAVPAAEERQEMYKREHAETDATLSFELAEKVLRDRLRWLMLAGAGLRAMVAATLAHSVAMTANMGQQGQAAGGTAAGRSRAPEEEVLVPFPRHVLARLQGSHLPTLPDLVLSDQARLARWCARYKAAMAAEAAATAAAAGAQMMAAGAGGVEGGAGGVSAAAGVPAAGGQLSRTDAGASGGPAAGTAAVLQADTQGDSSSSGGKEGHGVAAAAASPAGPQEHTPTDTPTASATAGPADKPASATATGTAGGRMSAELQRAAVRSGLPLDLLAAAVEADVQVQEAAAARASKGDIAWRLLHDASMAVGKEQAVLLPELRKAVGGVIPTLVTNSHSALYEALTQLSKADPSSPAFDLSVLEVIELLEHHHKVLETEVLQALAQSDSKHALRSLASSFRRAAASAPTRPHTWLLSGAQDTVAAAGGVSSGGRAGRWVSAAVGAASGLVKAPVRAGVALVDSAADAAHYGVSGVPLKA